MDSCFERTMFCVKSKSTILCRMAAKRYDMPKMLVGQNAPEIVQSDLSFATVTVYTI